MDLRILRLQIALLKIQTRPLFVNLHDKYSTNLTINGKCLGLEPGVGGLQVQMNPLSYGGTPVNLFM